jgi:hypothetical protein
MAIKKMDNAIQGTGTSYSTTGINSNRNKPVVVLIFLVHWKGNQLQ